MREFQWHWAKPCGANFVASKPEFKFRAFFRVWESEFSLQWRCIKNSVVNGLLLYNAVCTAILCMTSGPATLDQCTCSVEFFMQIPSVRTTVKSFTFSSTTQFFMERSIRLSKSVEATEIGYK